MQGNQTLDSDQTAIRESALALPGYTIVSELGVGGMATVYLAIQTSFGRKIALKVMAPALAADASYGERFLREARIAATMSHPNLITVYDVGVHQHCYYIAMEYHCGGDLKQRIQRGMAPKAAENVLRQMSSALDYAHTKGYVHRDVKPDNILFREDGNAVLTDFGIARATDGQTRMTQLGMVVGTPKYMSPEQARGKEVGPYSDLYALGIVFYEMLTGSVPFDGADSIEIGIKHLREPVPPLPDDVAMYQPIIDRLLAKAPEDRYARGRELLQDLDRLRIGAEIPRSAAPTRTLRAEPDDRPSGTPLPRAAHAASRWPRKTLATLAIITAAAGGGYWWINTPDGAGWLQTQANRPEIRNAAATVDNWLAANNIPLRVNTLLPTETVAPPIADVPTPPTPSQPAVGQALTPIPPPTVSRESRSLAAQVGLGGLDPLRPGNVVAPDTLDKIGDSAVQQLATGLAASATGGSAAPVLASIPAIDTAIGNGLPATSQASQADQPAPAAGPDARSSADKDRIQALLTRAADAVQANQLTEPTGASAVDYYHQVLALKPDDAQAADGLQIVAKRLVEMAAAARKAGNFDDATSLLDRAATVSPQLAGISDERKALATAERIEKQRKAERAAAQRADVMLGQFRIKGLLLQADTAMRQEHFVAPAGDNALDKYREVLRLDPTNATARNGLRQLESTLSDRLQAAIAVADWPQVEHLMAQLQLVSPNNPAIARAQAAIAAHAATPPPPSP